jgi:hypothetical protein
LKPNFTNMTVMNKYLRILTLVLTSFLIPACNLFEEEEAELDYFITSFDSLSDAQIIGDFSNDGRESNNLKVSYLSVSKFGISVWVENDITFPLMIEFENKNGDYGVTSVQSGKNAGIRLNNGSTSLQTKGGSLNVSGISVNPIDESRGFVSFYLKGNVAFQRSSGPDLVIDFDVMVMFDNKNDPPKPVNPIVDGNNPGSGNPGDVANCKNSINISSLISYWSQIDLTAADLVDPGTGRRTTADKIFSNLSSNDVALIIEGPGKTRNPATNYLVQILIPRNSFKANTTIQFRNGGAGTGLTDGAIGVLVASRGTVNDGWRTNRDFGKNKNMGTLTILTTTPKITGTYQFEASGDGYPSLNNQFAKLSGTFCIDP